LGNETLIKVRKSKNTLNISNRSQGNPIDNGLDLTRIHANVIFRDDVAQEFQVFYIDGIHIFPTWHKV
jgi:hypothetical protein